MNEATLLTGELSILTQTPRLWTVARVAGEKAVGLLPPGIRDGDLVTLHGRVEDDPKWGRQFRFTRCESTLPSGLSGVRRYLDRHFKWIGPKTAAAILARFGEGFFRVVEEEPERLTEVRGITAARAQEIRETWLTRKEDREVDEFFARCGLTPSAQARIFAALVDGFDRYKKLSDIPREERLRIVSLVRQNPYRLIDDVDGIGFARADSIARRLTFDFSSPFRVRAGIFHALHSAATDGGHCFLPEPDLVHAAADLLSADSDIVSREADTLVESGKIVRRGERIHLPVYLAMEERVAARLRALAAVRRDRPFDPDDSRWSWLVPKQRDALRLAMTSNLLVVTGLPGTGKTTIQKAIVEAFGDDVAIELAAPTGKAAKRMAQQIGRPARTVHRLLAYHPEEGFRINAENPLDAGVVIVDEASMLDLELADALLAAVDPESTTLILVGDVNQLPSVGPGRFLSDTIESGVCPVVALTEILRQDEAGLIVKNAHRVHRGEPLETDNKQDFYLAHAETPEAIAATVLDVLKIMPGRLDLSARDFQVLCPSKKSLIGTEALNPALSRLLNPDGMKIPGSALRVGDRVIQRRNKYDRKTRLDDGTADAGVFNGETGFVEAFDAREKLIRVRFDGFASDYGLLAADDELMPAWALTVHKAQGSEYPAVVIPLHTANYLLLQRNLLYTAITRGSRYVFVVGSRKAIGIAIANDRVQRRFTSLAGMLREAAGA